MRFHAALLALALLAVPGAAGDRDFDAVVRSIESRYGVRRTHIPLFGLVKFAVRIARPAGVKQLDLAIFEGLRYAPESQEDFEEAVRDAAGGRWSPIIRVRSRGESTHIYMRESGKNVQLLVATLNRKDGVILRLQVNPEALVKHLDRPEHMAHNLGSE